MYENKVRFLIQQLQNREPGEIQLRVWVGEHDDYFVIEPGENAEVIGDSLCWNRGMVDLSRVAAICTYEERAE
jgi:hypothetical protein